MERVVSVNFLNRAGHAEPPSALRLRQDVFHLPEVEVVEVLTNLVKQITSRLALIICQGARRAGEQKFLPDILKLIEAVWR